jgi:hypothetical protein
MKQEPRNAFTNFAFGDGALCASPAIVDNIEKSRFASLRRPRDDVQASQTEFDVAPFAFV